MENCAWNIGIYPIKDEKRNIVLINVLYSFGEAALVTAIWINTQLLVYVREAPRGKAHAIPSSYILSAHRENIDTRSS